MTIPPDKRWQSLSRRALVERPPWISVWVEQIRLPNGTIIDEYFTLALRSWVAVFAVTPDGRVPLVRQYRYGIHRHTLELPAGYLEGAEPPEECARRELREEAGCEAAAFRVLGQFATLPTRSAMTMHLVLAEGVRVVGAQALEATEEIEVRWVTLDALRELWLRGDEIVASDHSAAIARGLAGLGAL
jgi:ADP-ribose pyrophosphatase